MTDKTAKEVTFKEHVDAIYNTIPSGSHVNIEVRITWSKKLQDYTICAEYYSTPSTLVRLTIRKPKDS